MVDIVSDGSGGLMKVATPLTPSDTKPFKTTRLNYSEHGDSAQYPLDTVAIRYARQAGFTVEYDHALQRHTAARHDMPGQSWKLTRNRAARWEWREVN